MFGVSGGNVKDRSKAFCCSGTLGSLLTDGSTEYILSNNHVLARSGKALEGEEITQPGLIDSRCQPAEVVAYFTAAPDLGSNVDAAIAELVGGQMKSDGLIQDIGPISSVVSPAAVGLAVAKSGRTTGFTTGTISSVATSVSIQYQAGCNAGKKFTVFYSNQVVVTGGGGSFSARGDSGSLIVTNETETCHQPVALLFAGSSSSTIGNPIGEVLTKVSSALGSVTPFTFVGDSCGSSAQALISPDSRIWPTQEAVEHAARVMNPQLESLMALPSVIGVGVGASDENNSEAVIVVYIDTTTGVTPVLPSRIGGVGVKVVFTDPFVAY
ncbi:MAG: hypothetical protein HY650_10065 [Acidobacteria bacterium]|nr:hypothetical protein [Acidobacteriota bacterium]